MLPPTGLSRFAITLGRGGELRIGSAEPDAQQVDDAYLLGIGAYRRHRDAPTFVTPKRDWVHAVLVDAGGNPIVIGYTEGDIVGDGRIRENTTWGDTFVTKVIWGQ